MQNKAAKGPLDRILNTAHAISCIIFVRTRCCVFFKFTETLPKILGIFLDETINKTRSIGREWWSRLCVR